MMVFHCTFCGVTVVWDGVLAIRRGLSRGDGWKGDLASKTAKSSNPLCWPWKIVCGDRFVQWKCGSCSWPVLGFFIPLCRPWRRWKFPLEIPLPIYKATKLSAVMKNKRPSNFPV